MHGLLPIAIAIGFGIDIDRDPDFDPDGSMVATVAGSKNAVQACQCNSV